MTIFISILFCLLYAISGIFIFKWKINSYKRDRDEIEAWAQENANVIADKIKENEDLARYLDGKVREIVNQRKINEDYRNILKEKDREIMEIYSDNIKLIADNKFTLKENKIQLFNIREASIFAYKQYESIEEMLRNLLVFDDGEHVIFKHIKSSLRPVAKSKLSISNYFKSYFKVSPEDYLKKTKNIIGKKPDGSDYISESKQN